MILYDPHASLVFESSPIRTELELMSGLRWAKVDFHVFLRTFLSSFVGSFVVVGLNGLNEPCHSLLRAKTPSRCLSGQTSASRDVFLNLRIFCKLFFKLYQLAEEFGF